MPRATFIVRSILVLTLWAAVAAMPQRGAAFDGATVGAWHATWHAPYAPHSPLRTYFIPRLPGRCDRNAYSESLNCTGYNGDRSEGSGGFTYAPGCDMGGQLPPGAACWSVRFERLGQIQNDLDVNTSIPAAVPGR